MGNTTERNAYLEQYDALDFSECPCMCKYKPSESARRRQWWGDSGRRRRSDIRSGEETTAVAAQANCPFAADHEDTQATTQSTGSSGSSSASTGTTVDIVVSSTFTFDLPDVAVNAIIDTEQVRSAFETAFKRDIGEKLGLGSTASSRRIAGTALRRGSLIVDFTVTSPSGSFKKITDEKFAERMTGDISLEYLSSDVILTSAGISFPASVPASSATTPEITGNDSEKNEELATTPEITGNDSEENEELTSGVLFLRPRTLAVSTILSAMVYALSVQ